MTWHSAYDGWLYLSVAIITSVLGTFYMKLAAGFKYIKPTVLFILYFIISFSAMTYALQYMDLSLLYAVWSGVGTLLVAFTGMLYFDERFSLKKGFFLLLIILGVVGIHTPWQI